MSNPTLEKEQRRSALLAALKTLTPEMKALLRQRKVEGNRLRRREDLVWHLLLQSFATMGNSRGWKGSFGTPGLAAQVSYATLRRWPPAARRLRIEMVLRKAKVRMAAKKAEWLASNFQSIENAGGVKVVTGYALSLATREAKYRFMETSVPELSRFFGIVIRMFVEAGGQHNRAHFHAYYQEHAAVFAVDTIECLGGELPVPQRRLVEAWAEIHRTELQQDWELLQSGQPPVKIEPLR